MIKREKIIDSKNWEEKKAFKGVICPYCNNEHTDDDFDDEDGYYSEGDLYTANCGICKNDFNFYRSEDEYLTYVSLVDGETEEFNSLMTKERQNGKEKNNRNR